MARQFCASTGLKNDTYLGYLWIAVGQEGAYSELVQRGRLGFERSRSRQHFVQGIKGIGIGSTRVRREAAAAFRLVLGVLEGAHAAQARRDAPLAHLRTGDNMVTTCMYVP